MADSKKAGGGYAGKIPQSGVMNIKAPSQTVPPKNSTVKTGTDLRTGKK